MIIADIKKPTLVLNRARARANLRKMAQKANKSQVDFRPHFKTHQSAEIGEMFRQEGVTAITVTNVDMAEYFSRNGWNDITIAFPVNLRQIDEINALARKISLGLLVESMHTVDFLRDHLKHPADIWIKIDVGYGRAGLASDDLDGIKEIAAGLNGSGPFRYQGLLTHAGHSYHVHGASELKKVFNDSRNRLTGIRDFLEEHHIPGTRLSVGDTPTCSVMEDFSGIDEIRPGNFIFNDVMQMLIGSCRLEQIAVALACPVVAKHPERKEVVIYGGAVHLSKEAMLLPDQTRTYGLIALAEKDGWGTKLENTFVSSVSQEHGIIKTDGNGFEKIHIGDLIYVLPVHSCLAVNLMKEYLTLEGESITAHWS